MYNIIYSNLGKWTGGGYADSKWDEQPNEPIAELTYELFGITVTLKNYEAYNHIVERIALIGRKESLITKVILMAKKGEQVLCLIWDIRKHEFTKEVQMFGAEYCGRPTTCWKEGLQNETPSVTIN